ncbi:MAG TPA: YncE family protein [Ktedonobacterales bacterium]|nr:YncE family protein [Ktedonobacterales bacterium]
MRRGGWRGALALVALLVALATTLATTLAGCALSGASGAQGTASAAPTPIATLTLPAPLASYSVFVTDVLTGNLAELGKYTWRISPSIHGLGLSADGKTLYVTDVATNRLFAFDLSGGSPKEIHSVEVGAYPVHMVGTSDGSVIFVSSFGGASVAVVDGHTWTLRKTITTPERPHSIVISPDGRWVYAGCYGGAAIAVINVASESLAATIPLPNLAEPYGLAISPDGHYLYASDNLTGRLFAVDALERRVVASIAVGLHPALIARSPDGKTLYVANGGSHSVSVVDISRDPAHPTVRATVVVTGYPHGIAVTPDGRYVVVANTSGKDLSVIDTKSLKVISTIPGEQYPNDVLITG